MRAFAVRAAMPFLSTPSARRATYSLFLYGGIIPISIHALREEGDSLSAQVGGIPNDFYPRPPRGGRLKRRPNPVAYKIFLSTPSARRATQQRHGQRDRSMISIHALREEGDP